jgi:aquaporin Z
MLSKKLAAEALGTFWLVFGGCGSAVLASQVLIKEGETPINIGINLVGIALAFGLTVLTMAYAIGHISGCHLNPAVSVGLCVAGRFKLAELGPYVLAQLVGGVLGSAVLYVIASGVSGFAIDPSKAGAFATNGYGDRSPGGYSLLACLVTEVVLTFMFLMIILGSTDARAPAGFAPLAIGFGLALIHFVGIPVTNLSVNPARSTAPALFVGGAALAQLWLFWVAPIVGATLAGVAYRALAEAPPAAPPPANRERERTEAAAHA